MGVVSTKDPDFVELLSALGFELCSPDDPEAGCGGMQLRKIYPNK